MFLLIPHFLWHLLGIATGMGSVHSVSASGWMSAFWSTFGNTFFDIGLLGTPYVLWKKHNCHVKGCWRIGRQGVQESSWIVCHKHHPEDKPTHTDILSHHARISGQKELS